MDTVSLKLTPDCRPLHPPPARFILLLLLRLLSLSIFPRLPYSQEPWVRITLVYVPVHVAAGEVRHFSRNPRHMKMKLSCN